MANWRAWLTRATRQPALPCQADSRAIMDEAMSGSPGEHALQDALGTRDRAARFSRDQVSAVLTPRTAAARPWRVGTWRANAGDLRTVGHRNSWQVHRPQPRRS